MQKLVWIEHVQGNKIFPMQDLGKKVIDELSVPWEDVFVVKLLGRARIPRHEKPNGELAMVSMWSSLIVKRIEQK